MAEAANSTTSTAGLGPFLYTAAELESYADELPVAVVARKYVPDPKICVSWSCTLNPLLERVLDSVLGLGGPLNRFGAWMVS